VGKVQNETWCRQREMRGLDSRMGTKEEFEGAIAGARIKGRD
jgi:hypothetical protein